MIVIKRLSSSVAASSQIKFKPDSKLLQKIRKEFEGASIKRVAEALTVTNNDYSKAKEWLNEQMMKDGIKRAEKVEQRTALEGFIVGAERDNLGSVLFEINCETDFVAKNSLFQQLSARIAASALLDQSQSELNSVINHIDVTSLLQKPLLPDPKSSDFEDQLKNTMNFVKTSETIQSGIIEGVARLGEKINLKRATVVHKSFDSGPVKKVVESFIHGKINYPSQSLNLHFGKIGSIIVMESECSDSEVSQLRQLGKKLAQHIVGMNPEDVEALLAQPYLFDPTQTVRTLLQGTKIKNIKIASFCRFQCGK